MFKNLMLYLVLLAPVYSASTQDFGKVFVATGVGLNVPLGELGSKDFSKPGGVADQGYKFDLISVCYQFENGFGLGIKTTTSFYPVNNKLIEDYILSEGAEQSHADVKSWKYSELLFRGSKSLFQTEKHLINVSIGVGPAMVIKPKEHFEGTYFEGSKEYWWTYDQHKSLTLSSNLGLNYWIKITDNFCLVASVDYSYTPFSMPYFTTTESANRAITTNGEEVAGFEFATEASPKHYSIQGISTGLKLGFSF